MIIMYSVSKLLCGIPKEKLLKYRLQDNNVRATIKVNKLNVHQLFFLL